MITPNVKEDKGSTVMGGGDNGIRGWEKGGNGTKRRGYGVVGWKRIEH